MMKRLAAGLGLGLALAAGTAVTPAQAAWLPAQGRVTDGNCVYKADRDTFLYEDRQWTRQHAPNTFFDRISEGTYVAGHCGSTDGWKQIKYVHFGSWGPVRYFDRDRDFMRTSHLTYVGRY